MFDILYNTLIFSKDLINIIYEYSNDYNRIVEKIINNYIKIKETNEINNNNDLIFTYNNNKFDEFRKYIDEISNIKIIFDIDIKNIYYASNSFNKTSNLSSLTIRKNDIYKGSMYLIIDFSTNLSSYTNIHSLTCIKNINFKLSKCKEAKFIDFLITILKNNIVIKKSYLNDKYLILFTNYIKY